MEHMLLLLGFAISLSAIVTVSGLGQADDLPGWLGERWVFSLVIFLRAIDVSALSLGS